MLFHLITGPAPRGAIAPAKDAAFVHLSRSEQIDTVRRRHFAGKAVRALAIDELQLDAAKLRDEDLYGHGAYPHYYGVIPADAIMGERTIPAVTRADVEAAHEVVRRFFPPTPLLPAPRLSDRFGAEVSIKLESATPIRTFKIRGALNKTAALAATGAKGVATASAGNHGLAAAWAARRFELPCVVVVPANANPRKVEAIAREAAEVVHHGVDYQAALEKSLEIAAARGYAVVHAYDDPFVVAGQGTIALELPPADVILCGVGGGGLIAGLAVALSEQSPRARLIGVQPEGADSMVRSLAAGSVVSIDQVDTIADGLGARRPSALTLELTAAGVERVVRVADARILEASSGFLRDERWIAEPAGAACLAALLQDPSLAQGKVTLILSGANISDAVLDQVCR